MAFYFNPRFPRGKRRPIPGILGDDKAISIHASRGGSDLKTRRLRLWLYVFQSTLPAGEATFLSLSLPGFLLYFNPRFPRGKRLS